ncbi:MAG: FtsX-like permease family protein, partial [Acidimicrobiales bacterium]
MFRAVRWLNLRRVSRQPLRAALALAAVAAGASLVVAVLVTSASVTTAVRRFNSQIAGPAPLRVVGAAAHGAIEPRVVDAIARSPGVRSAVPVIQAITYVEDRVSHPIAVVVFGVDCRAEALTGSLGCNAAARPPVVISAQLRAELGPGAVVRTDDGRVPLSEALATPALDSLNQGRVVVLPLDFAQRVFARNGRFDVVYVVPRPGAQLAAVRSAVAAAVGPQNTVLRASDNPPWGGGAGPLVPLLAMVSLFALAIGALLVYNITTLSLAERRRDLAIVAALGGTDRLTIAGAVSEAAVLGALGGAVGAGVGIIIAHFVVAKLNGLTGLYTGVHIGVTVPPSVYPEAVLIGLVASALASAIPARRAARLNVSQQLQERREPDAVRKAAGARAAVALGVGVLGVGACHLAARGGGLHTWQQPLAMVGLVLTIIGLFAGVGLLTPPVIAALRRRPEMRRGEVGLAAASLVRDTGRTAVVATSVSIVVGFGVLLAGALPSIRAMSTRFSTITADGRVAFNTLPLFDAAAIDAKASPGVLARARALPGVASIDRSEFLLLGRYGANQPLGVSASEHPAFPYRMVAGSDPAGVLARGQILVGSTLARRKHLRPGSSLVLDAPGGRVGFVVGGVWESIDELGNSVTVGWDAAQHVWGPQPVNFVFARPAPGVTTEQLAATLRSSGLDPDLRVATPPEWGEAGAREFNNFLGPFRVLQRGLLLVALIAVMATLLLVGVQRRRELGILAAVGMSPSKLGRQALLEAGITGTIAAVLTVAACLPVSMAFRDALLFIVGTRTTMSLPQ